MVKSHCIFLQNDNKAFLFYSKRADKRKSVMEDDGQITDSIFISQWQLILGASKWQQGSEEGVLGLVGRKVVKDEGGDIVMPITNTVDDSR